MDHREEQLRQRAYDIWQAEGEPHGRDRDHWELAERELGEASAAENPAEVQPAEVQPNADPAPARRKAAGTKASAVAPATIQDDGVTVKPKARKPRTSKA